MKHIRGPKNILLFERGVYMVAYNFLTSKYRTGLADEQGYKGNELDRIRANLQKKGYWTDEHTRISKIEIRDALKKVKRPGV